MPRSQNFRIDSGSTMKMIMNPKPPAPPNTQQGKMEMDLAKHLVKQMPKKSSRSKPPPLPKVVDTTKKTAPNKGIVKEDLILKILKYQTNLRFGKIIQKELGFKYTRNQLSKFTIDNLETILHRIRTHLNTRNMDQVFEHMAKVSAKGYEDLVTGFGYNIEGFSDILWANPAFHDAFERWKIERKIPDIPPSFQLMYIIASTTYIAHLQNPAPKPIPQSPKMKTDKNKNEEKTIPPLRKSKLQPGEIII